MTDSVYQVVRAALDTHLAGTVGIPSIYHENVKTEPTTGTAFIKTQLIPGFRRPAIRGVDPQHLYNGVYQCLLHYPHFTGPGSTDLTVDKIVNRFNSTTDISYTSPSAVQVDVRIRETNRRASYHSEPWYITPVQIDWYLYK